MEAFLGNCLLGAWRRDLPGWSGVAGGRSVRRPKQVAKGGAGAEKAGAYGVDGELEEVSDFGVAELFEFAEEEDFAVDRIELFDGAADPEGGFGGVPFGGFSDTFRLAEEGRVEGGLAAIGAKNFEGDGVEVSAEEGAGFVAGRGAEKDQEGFLREFFGVMGIGGAAAEEAVDRLLVAEEEFVKGFGGAFGEGEHELLVAGGAGWDGGCGRRVVHNDARQGLRV